jgi:YggT family protein
VGESQLAAGGPIWHLTAPLLRPIQRVVPRLGGFDISPLILFVIAQILLMVIANVSRGVA